MFQKIFLAISIIITMPSCIPEKTIIKEKGVTRDIISEWQRRNEFLKNFKARARIFISTPESFKRFNAVYVASLPRSFRVEILSPFGQTIAGVASDGDNIYALNLNDNLCFKSPSDEKNLAKFIPLDILPGMLVDFLISRIPFFEDKNITINSIEDGRVEVSVKGEKEEDIFFDGRSDFMVSGQLDDLIFKFERFFESAGVIIPSRIVLKSNEIGIIIDVENPIINTDVRRADFVFDFPDDCIFTDVGIF